MRITLRLVRLGSLAIIKEARPLIIGAAKEVPSLGSSARRCRHKQGKCYN